MSCSVCIPTFRRHELLMECVRSVFASTVRPLEIVVSDDAHEPALRARLEALDLPAGVTLRYVANARASGQAGNVQNAFEHARHERVVLIHDDDFFCPGGLDALHAAWEASGDEVDAVFGRTRLVGADGSVLDERTRRHNTKYFRDAPGRPSSNLWSALVQQFPYNGMMLRRSLAVAVGVPSETEVGKVPIDLHFGINYALATSRPFLLIDADVSVYRLSTLSVLRGQRRHALDGHLNYRKLKRLEPRVGTEAEAEALGQRLAGAAGPAILALLAADRIAEARRVFDAHFATMRGSWRLRLKVLVVVAGCRLGIRWPHWILAQRGK
jgi:glycosyltransferase involved in cell wall biosynthesis